MYDYIESIYYNNNCKVLLVELNKHYGVIDVYENILVDIIYDFENYLTEEKPNMKLILIFLDENNNEVLFDLEDIYEESKKIQNIKLIYK